MLTASPYISIFEDFQLRIDFDINTNNIIKRPVGVSRDCDPLNLKYKLTRHNRPSLCEPSDEIRTELSI